MHPRFENQDRTARTGPEQDNQERTARTSETKKDTRTGQPRWKDHPGFEKQDRAARRGTGQ
jgi:hypothetical protein